MRLLHTSDWHLGRSLYGRKRDKEFSSFLHWLLETMTSQEIDTLLISGDIFDTTTPSNWAQTLYYQFLTQVASTGCRHVIITAGNHDSATFLEAPSGILQTMDIHVVGAADGNPQREIIPIKNDEGALQCIVLAVPYLREKDIRSSSPGETIEEKSVKLVQAIEAHYQEVIAQALKLRENINNPVPIVGMGHLFAAGGQSVKGDGVRELYVGSLAHVPASIFPREIDYLALGHLHRAQRVAQSETMRYCGSPLPMSFQEALRGKQVVIIDLDGKVQNIQELEVPTFQRLISISGDLVELQAKIEELKALDSSVWLEVNYTGGEIVTSLQEDLHSAVSESKVEILRIINSRIIDSYLASQLPEESLEQLTVEEVFERCLTQNDIEPEECKELQLRFNKAVEFLHQQETK